jgi:hypothetical protein
MNRKTIGKVLVLASLALFCPVALQAQTASEHFPNDDGGFNVQVVGEMTVSLKVLGLQQIKTTDVLDAAPPTAGDAVAVSAVNKLCTAALASGLFCNGTIPAACAGAGCCAAVAAGGGQSVECDTIAGAGPPFGNGFIYNRPFLATSFTVSPTPGGNKLQTLNCRTNAGNTHGPDLLPRVNVQLQPNGVAGSVVFRVTHSQGGANPRTFTITNASTLSDAALHDAIAAGYNAMGLGLNARAVRFPASFDPDAFSAGNAVEVTYTTATQATLQQFEVDAQRGQIVALETLDPAEVPGTSTWAVALLIGLLLASSVWLLRRRVPREA